MSRSLRGRALQASVALAGLLASCLPASALINPSLQPADLYVRHRCVLVGHIESVDLEAASLTLRVDRVVNGEFTPETIRVRAADATRELLVSQTHAGAFEEGTAFVAFVGSKVRGQSLRWLLFWDGFALGRMSSADTPGDWLWEAIDAGPAEGDEGPATSLSGTWAGSTAELIRLVEDVKEDRAFLPRRAYVRFREDAPLDQLPGPGAGVALYDLDLDGDLDVFACSPGGVRAYLQTDAMKFVDATDALGLAEVKGRSCSFADVDADGDADLLIDDRLFLRQADRFVPAALLPAGTPAAVHVSAFVEFNGDGFPDVLISRPDGGLQVLVNPGADGGPFRDATAAIGLDQPDRGAGQTGYVTVGDWNGDGRIDLFYAAASGFLLVQDADGAFAPVEHDIPFEFYAGQSGKDGMTGAGCMAPFVHADRNDLMIPGESGWYFVAQRDGVPVDLTPYGGEISEGSFMHLATIACDLNADGYPDAYTICGGANGRNRFIINRGYGLFMWATPNRAYEQVFVGPAHNSGGAGVAAGDVNADGAMDLLIADEGGRLTLLLNDTLAWRARAPKTTDDERRLAAVRLLPVTVRGPVGVLGATVVLRDAAGRPLATHLVGGNVATGCRGPDGVTFAVRDPGRYRLQVRYADGLEVSRPIEIGDVQPSAVTITRAPVVE